MNAFSVANISVTSVDSICTSFHTLVKDLMNAMTVARGSVRRVASKNTLVYIPGKEN